MVFCKECGAENLDNAVYCQECGAKQLKDEIPKKSHEKKKSRKKRKSHYIMLAGAIILIMMLIFTYLVHSVSIMLSNIFLIGGIVLFFLSLIVAAIIEK
jgi:uncharacterized membrane protein YvbJ